MLKMEWNVTRFVRILTKFRCNRFNCLFACLDNYSGRMEHNKVTNHGEQCTFNSIIIHG